MDKKGYSIPVTPVVDLRKSMQEKVTARNQQQMINEQRAHNIIVGIYVNVVSRYIFDQNGIWSDEFGENAFESAVSAAQTLTVPLWGFGCQVDESRMGTGKSEECEVKSDQNSTEQ